MIRYLFAAFFARPRIPGFGHLPLNAMGVTLLGLLGLLTNNPGYWFLGLGLETAYLSLLATNQRFRNIVDGRRLESSAEGESAAAPAPQEELSGSARQSVAKIDAQLGRTLALYAQSGVDDFLASSNRESLGTLRNHYVKLLQAEESIERHWSGDPETLKREVARIERELQEEGMTEELRASRLKTLEINQMRLENQTRKANMLAEIASELRRIEAQFELALENAAMSSQPSSISADLAVDLTGMDPRLFTGGATDSRSGRKSRAKESEKEAT